MRVVTSTREPPQNSARRRIRPACHQGQPHPHQPQQQSRHPAVVCSRRPWSRGTMFLPDRVL